MSTPLLVDYFNQLPDHLIRRPGTWPTGMPDQGRSGGRPQAPPGGKARARAALDGFKQQVLERYNQGTLLRLLHSHDARGRRAAAFALGLVGSSEVSPHLAVCLHDDDADVAAVAGDALWAVWFRGDSPPHSDELQRLVKLRDRDQALAGLDRLVERAPTFAEAYNQRAILAFRLRQFDRAI